MIPMKMQQFFLIFKQFTTMKANKLCYIVFIWLNNYVSTLRKILLFFSGNSTLYGITQLHIIALHQGTRINRSKF